MIIDAHNHVWPDKVARRRSAGNVPDMEYFGDGTVAGLAAAAGGRHRPLGVPGRGQHRRPSGGGEPLHRRRSIGVTSYPSARSTPTWIPEENLATCARHGVRA